MVQPEFAAARVRVRRVVVEQPYGRNRSRHEAGVYLIRVGDDQVTA
jgi:hypothetical protein